MFTTFFGGENLSYKKYITVSKYKSFKLESGRSFGPITVAYEVYGQLNDEKDNCILILHASTGDSHPARHDENDREGWWEEFVKRALKLKRHVVTANKDLIAEHGKELLDIAKDSNVILSFEASVGGGIPILKPLRECLIENEIKEIRAVINGTTNFILLKMYKENMRYDNTLRLAQRLRKLEN